MKRMIESITGNYSSSASVVDGTLILSLPDAITPVVWRMDMVHAKASALEVRTTAENAFTLVLKTPRGDVNEVASFSNRGRAVSALMAVTRAMETAHGQVYPIANDSQPYNPGHLPVPARQPRARKISRNGKNWAGAAVALILILLIGWALVGMAPRQMIPTGASTTANSGASSNSAAPASGVAISADDFLKNQ